MLRFQVLNHSLPPLLAAYLEEQTSLAQREGVSVWVTQDCRHRPETALLDFGSAEARTRFREAIAADVAKIQLPERNVPTSDAVLPNGAWFNSSDWVKFSALPTQLGVNLNELEFALPAVHVLRALTAAHGEKVLDSIRVSRLECPPPLRELEPAEWQEYRQRYSERVELKAMDGKGAEIIEGLQRALDGVPGCTTNFRPGPGTMIFAPAEALVRLLQSAS